MKMANEMEPRYTSGLAASSFVSELAGAPPVATVTLCTRMQNQVKSGMKKRPRKSMSLTATRPAARAHMPATMATASTAGGTPLWAEASVSSCDSVMTMRAATTPMSTSTSAKNGLKRMALKYMRFGMSLGGVTPSIMVHALRS